MGVGRFVYTPVLPLMQTQAGLSASAGAHLATANYAGYLGGALAGTLIPGLVRSPAALRASLVALTGSLAAMPVTHGTTVWLGLRLVAGVASALVFVIAVTSVLGVLRGHPAHLPGWAFGGVGAGIAASGLLVLGLSPVADWRAVWWASAALTALLAGAAWRLRLELPATPASTAPAVPVTLPVSAVSAVSAASVAEGAGRPTTTRRRRRWFAVLLASYTLEGTGYIVAGTFLVAAVAQTSPGWVGSGAWVLVGLAAVPSAALWTRLGRRRPLHDLLLAALVVQAVGIALPALVSGVAAALLSAVLFGATFIGISTLALATGAWLQVHRSVGLLTAGYSVGQILGPLAVTPLLRDGYRPALLLAAAVVLTSAAAAAALRVGLRHPTAATRTRRRPTPRQPATNQGDA
ncbi:YbfB/YjiJ family MFS transporter [Streptomyces sp. NPDC020951]|uniref:YbfB/YjiJ family MFS transporter n=1 Tax=Streptomyces sp. NPDC020951 TaxID=3365104 RepID=UPI00379B5238